MRSAGWEVTVLRSSCQNSGNISLVLIVRHRKNYTQPRAEAEQAPPLSRRISPRGDPQARAVRGGAVYRCQCRRCEAFGEIRKSTPGSKTDKQLFSFQDCLEAAKACLFIYLFNHPSFFVGFLLCFALSCFPIHITMMIIINWLAFPQVLPQFLRKRFVLTNRLPVLTQTCLMFLTIAAVWESCIWISGLAQLQQAEMYYFWRQFRKPSCIL